MTQAPGDIRRLPSSTYRLQIHQGFTLDQATAVLPYLAQLGVDAVYLSPLLRAARSSNHGYDVVDHTEVDPDRGGVAQLENLTTEAQRLGLACVIDIVPNHMGVADASQNLAWWELLRTGRSGSFGAWFDVDWEHPSRILLPVLGDDADLSTELAVIDGELRYYDHRFPIAPGTEGGTPTDVHDRQFYELVNFRRADVEQNYRRFFAVTELAGLRVEDQDVFKATHAEILRWVSDYGLAGIRIDHPDGLADPLGYLERLAAAAPGAWILVEKITEPGERLPTSWPVAGMTGYDALAEVNAVLVDPACESALTSAYLSVTGDDRTWQRHVEDGKRQVASTILRAEIRRIARLCDGGETTTPADEPPSFSDIVAALTEIIVAFGVYRSYLPDGGHQLQSAIDVALSRRPHLAGTIEELRPRLFNPTDEVAIRMQQATGAVMAKGVEDTAYYRYSRLISLNEVGGDPGTVGLGVADFHTAMMRRQNELPLGMTTLSTHDTKRAEDVRARIAVLAEIPQQWLEAVTALTELAPIKNRAFGYLWWQTVVGTGFVERARLHAYAEKAMREASDGTRWIDPDAAFEAEVHAAVDAVFDDAHVHRVIGKLLDLTRAAGESNSLAQKLIQLTMPGIPDVYQGAELIDDSLVDPDNRRPVDFNVRASLLADLDAGKADPFVSVAATKLWLTAQALRVRRDRPELFTGYSPLLADGPAADHVVAFDRGGAITLATRLPIGLVSRRGWANTMVSLPPGEFTDVISGNSYSGRVGIADVLQQSPVALLQRS